MTQLETAIVMIMDVFKRCACNKGNKDTLTKGEVKTLMEKELLGIFGNAKEKDACDKIMKDLDENSEIEVDFNEFIVLVSALITIGHESLGNKPQKK